MNVPFSGNGGSSNRPDRGGGGGGFGTGDQCSCDGTGAVAVTGGGAGSSMGSMGTMGIVNVGTTTVCGDVAHSPVCLPTGCCISSVTRRGYSPNPGDLQVALLCPVPF